MKLRKIIGIGASLIWLGAYSPLVIASDDHDHGKEPVTGTEQALPRFVAINDRIEAVGIVESKRIVVYLDRFADNSPLEKAQLELSLDGRALAVEEHGLGEFEIDLKEPLKPTEHSVRLKVTTGGTVHTLESKFNLAEEAHNVPSSSVPSMVWIALAGGASAALVFGVVIYRRRGLRVSKQGDQA